MTKIDCQITKLIQSDFGALWRCQQRGNTVEISTPYMLPDSSLFSVFVTCRNGKYIVCDGGSVWEIVSEHCPLPDTEIKASLDGFSKKFEISECMGGDGQKLFFKSCDKTALIGSLVFDMASFVTTATSVLVAASFDEPDVEPDERFQGKADSFIKSLIPSDSRLKFKAHQQIKEVSGVKFSAVIKSASKIWVVSYVTGSHLTYFRKSIGETKMNFEHVWDSSLKGHVKTIPLLNTEAAGFQPTKLKWQLEMLKKSSGDCLVKWSDRDSIATLLTQ